MLGLFARFAYRESSRQSLEESHWQVVYDIKFRAEGEETSLRYAIPFQSEWVSIIGQEWGEPSGLNFRNVTLIPSRTHERVLSTDFQGEYTVVPKFQLQFNPRATERLDKLEPLNADGRARYLREEPTLGTRLEGVRKLLQQAGEESETEAERIQWIYNFCSAQLRTAEEGADNSVLSSLANGAATPIGRVRTMVSLCRASGIPARVVAGFELRCTDRLEPHHWLEVYRENRWWPFDPLYGYTWSMPQYFVPVRRGGEQIVRLSSIALDRSGDVKVKYSLERIAQGVDAVSSQRPGPTDMLDLTRLPVEMQKVLSLLLLLPFGALITAFCRNVVGIMTFGTFAPALFALSFIYSNWGTGLVILLVVITAGLTGRVMLERLRLLMVPRLSIILTISILCVVLCVSALDYLRLTPSADAVLLPLVILTILIERFTVTTEEDSLGVALRLVGGTLLVAAVCYFILRWDYVGRTILIYPEAHFLTISAFIAIGRYTGYRLVELWRFRDLVDDRLSNY